MLASDTNFVANSLTPDLSPPTYITDGNAYSFQEQGQALENRLTELKVPVQSLFYTDTKKEITHEYQFDYTLKESKNCYQQTLDFVNKYK